MPYIIDQGRTFLIDILALIVVAPLLTGLVIVLFRQSDRRRVVGSAGVAGGVIALGLIMYGVVNQMQNRPLFLTDRDILLSNGASAIGNVGLALSTAALIMGSVESVRIRRRGVVAGFYAAHGQRLTSLFTSSTWSYSHYHSCMFPTHW